MLLEKTFFVITKKNDRIKIYNYEGVEYLNTYNFTDYALYDKYIGLIANNTVYIYNDLNSNYIKNIPINRMGDLKLEAKGNQVVIKLDDEIIDYLN